MADEPISLAERRWEKTTLPNESSIPDMLGVLKARIERGEVEYDHAVVCVGRIEPDGSVAYTYYQAGKLDSFGQAGLVHCVSRMLDTSD